MKLIITTEEELLEIVLKALALHESKKIPAEQTDDWLGYTTKEACEKFKVSEKTLYRRRVDGTLGYTKGLKGEYRYRREDIEKYFERRQVRAVGD